MFKTRERITRSRHMHMRSTRMLCAQSPKPNPKTLENPPKTRLVGPVCLTTYHLAGIPTLPQPYLLTAHKGCYQLCACLPFMRLLCASQQNAAAACELQ